MNQPQQAGHTVNQAAISRMMAVTLRCKGIDFTAVTRDQAVNFVKSQCSGMTAAEVVAVVKNVFGDGPGREHVKVSDIVAKDAGQALEKAYPWGYRSTDSEP